MVSRTQLRRPQQHPNDLQFDFNEALTAKAKNPKNAPESVNQKALPNSLYQFAIVFYFLVANLISAPYRPKASRGLNTCRSNWLRGLAATSVENIRWMP